MSRIHSSVMFLLALTALFAVGCAAAPPEACAADNACVVVAPGDPIRIGLAAPTTGGESVIGIDILQGAQLATQDAGQFNGHSFELVGEDDKGTPEGGAAIAQQFVADRTIAAVVGHAYSGASEGAMPIYEEAQIPMVSPSATRADLTQRDSPVFNRVVPNDSAQGEVAAQYLYDTLGFTRVAILHDGSAYGQGLAERCRDVLENIGSQVVAYEEITPDQVDYSETLSVLAAANPQAVFFGGYETEAAQLAIQRTAAGLGAAVFISGDGIYGDNMIIDAGDAAEGYYSTAFSEPPNSPLKAAFDQVYLDTFNVEPGTLTSYTWTAYDAANVIIEAIRQVAIVADDNRLYIPRAALVEAVRATSAYQGLTGTISCDQRGECSAGAFDIFVVQNGTWVRVNP